MVDTVRLPIVGSWLYRLKKLAGGLGKRQTPPASGDTDFDADWYLRQYPDVAAAGMDPREHYLRFGRREGRLPGPNRAIALEFHLWRGCHDLLPVLKALVDDEGASSGEREYAAWACARWHLSKSEHLEGLPYLRRFRAGHYRLPSHVGPLLLLCEALLETHRVDEAAELIEGALKRRTTEIDYLLARINLAGHAQCAHRDGIEKAAFDSLHLINRLFESSGLEPVRLLEREQFSPLDNLAAWQPVGVAGHDVTALPKVSVIIPLFNAEGTLEAALRSLAEQSWPNLEVLIVDDASTDRSTAVAEEFISRSQRPGRVFRLLRQPQNQGAYAARNAGLAEATGDFITVHDSDDWSHPRKIECQVRLLQREPELMGSVSHWVRCTPALQFHHWRVEGSWVDRNVSSLMFRREVHEALGFWDRVRADGDTEFYYRMLAAFGEGAIGEVKPGVPLSFGRSHPASLTRQKETGLRTQFWGARYWYQDAARHWHASAKSATALFMPERPDHRLFPAPASLGDRSCPASVAGWSRALVLQSGLFDPQWYVGANPDVRDLLVEPWEHFWRHGAAEGRDPGPAFSTSGYQARYREQLADEMPLLHFLARGRKKGPEARPAFDGKQGVMRGRPWVLVVGHQAGKELYGAERSLLDVLAAMRSLRVNVVVALPSAVNTAYLDSISSLSQKLMVVPARWWRPGREADQSSVDFLAGAIRQYGVQLVYANTVVLYEPLVAARKAGVPVVVHGREMPAHDPALCSLLQATPAQVIEHVAAAADALIANSAYLAGYYNLQRSFVVPNTIDTSAFAVPLPLSSGLSVALISSNLPKKGLDDFVALARLLDQCGSRIQCLLVGPENAHTDRLRALAGQGELPSNFVFAGYARSAQEALSQADVVVNLSRFEESFGRTVLEAMAAARPVVCYRWGALPELVVHGETGYLVPLGDTAAVADCLERLAADEAECLRMGKAGKLRAEQYYSPSVMQVALADVFSALMHDRF